jgi:hypothetical protein
MQQAALFSGPSQPLPVRTPQLIVVVDTEEEFDWSRPFSRAETGVDHMRYLYRTQSIFERYGVRPTYVVDYSVASQEAAYRPLREWLLDGKCHVGAHLHPWVNPPFEEELSARNSYPGNLPMALEREKLARLTRVIEDHFGQRPAVYRAGRYGIGPATAAILEDLDYRIDTSVVPLTDFRKDGGPDFTAFDVDPYWLGSRRRVLEVPLSVVWYGHLNGYGNALRPFLMSNLGLRLRLPGVFSRLRLLERIRLTPEGTNLAELCRLTDTMLAAGKRHLVFSYHSPSVVPGNTPYVRTDADLRRFLALIEDFCDYFFGACAGTPGSLNELRDAWPQAAE